MTPNFIDENNVKWLFGTEATQAMTENLNAQPATEMKELAELFGEAATTAELLMRSATRQGKSISEEHTQRVRNQMEDLSRIAGAMAKTGNGLAEHYATYVQDAAKRWLLTLDVLRQRGDNFVEHEAAGCPPVLIYDYEVVVDGRNLDRPCNYQLLRIVPPQGTEVHDWKRPYIIIDPRAGHGGGIGGFKTDSQVGVALHDGHPVYFVNFTRDPVPGQTLADVTNAEAEFVREVQRRHPDSAKPVVTGNCQGGWATLLLAATNPDLTGPIVLNGAPVQPWSGEVGKYPMRYNGGILGGTWQPMLWSDLGGGQFDGANLVSNFEMLNPGRNFFAKYYDLFANPDGGKDRFLEFERWWGGFFILNEAEIKWIVEQLFVGNKLVKNQAQLEPGQTVDIKHVKAPIIVFTSYGDNITPPQQALNWIVDSFTDVDEIRIRGQRIIYMIHEQVGHLGIFVSSKVAKKEHTEVTSTMKTIEALPPGLYEMKIDSVEGHGQDKSFTVSFAERTIDDLRKIDDGREEEAGFAAVARMSEIQSEIYDIAVRPVVKSMVNPALSETMRKLHPLRLQRSLVSSVNPFFAMLENAAQQMDPRAPVSDSNPFVQAERLWARMVEQQMDFVRDARDALYEMTFLSLWTNPLAVDFGKPQAIGRTLKSETELRALPEVEMALAHMSSGGFVEAVVRMLVLMADSRGNVRRDRLERSATVMTQDEPFKSLTMDERTRIIHEQTLIVTFERDKAIATLPDLLPNKKDREQAVKVVQFIPGKIEEMAPDTLELLQQFHKVLGLKPVTEDVLEDPLKKTKPSTAAE
ncbi:DUF3141 domain-containing protein [Ruegeria arenilitoris]|uniref:DUF3141 domain-containing protein n=1 Tax=Ruegeria arenilitoris TaxID=1173585 RepID=UPI0020C529A4|nr:DUF3141 domain-containing protein [Ruegeria arenilitoris]